VRTTQPTPGSQTSLREANRARVVGAVQQHGSLTQVELAGITGLSPASVSNIVKELTASGLLDTSPATRSGRRARMVTLARSLGIVAGVDVSSRGMRVALADASMQVLSTETLPLAADHRADMGLQRAAMLVQEMVESIDAGGELLAAAIGVPAPVDVATGRVSSAGLLRGWDGADIASVLGASLRVPVRVDNHANLGALAEARYGAGAGHDPVVYVRVAHGVSGGIVLGVTIDENGLVCRCGNRGCLETVVGAPALLRALQGSHGHLTLGDVIALAIGGDAGCRRVLSDAGEHLGAAVATTCNLLDPEIVVVGGQLAAAGDLLLEPLRQAVAQRTIRSEAGPPAVALAEFGEEAEVRGALGTALDLAREIGALAVTP
jgi:predicted NBD/HSP70 family sugar kinase